jgi:hypothetical protein
MQCLLLFNGNNGYANAPESFVIYTLPLLLFMYRAFAACPCNESVLCSLWRTSRIVLYKLIADFINWKMYWSQCEKNTSPNTRRSGRRYWAAAWTTKTNDIPVRWDYAWRCRCLFHNVCKIYDEGQIKLDLLFYTLVNGTIAGLSSRWARLLCLWRAARSYCAGKKKNILVY